MQKGLQNPYDTFKEWIALAEQSPEPKPLSMTLATASKSGRPSARVVLYKGFSGDGLLIVTNYESRKGRELDENPYATLVFYFAAIEKQIRIEGRVEKIKASESQAYFKTRPRGSQLGAWASAQSSEIPSRDFLLAEVAALEKKYQGKDVPCPPNWGGYRLIPDTFEFWIGQESRLHERYLFKRSESGWTQALLSP